MKTGFIGSVILGAAMMMGGGCSIYEDPSEDSFDIELRGSDHNCALDGQGCDGCTRTRLYWRRHARRARRGHDDWPVPEDYRVCDSTLYRMVQARPRGNPWIRLSRQAVAAVLNHKSDAGMPPEVRDAVLRSRDLILECDDDALDPAEAQELTDLLRAYNRGHIGPGRCGADD